MTEQTEQLLDRFFDGEASETDGQRLAELLAGDRDLRIEFARRSRMDQSLRAMHQAQTIEHDATGGSTRVDTPAREDSYTPIVEPEPVARMRIGVVVSALAAAILIAGVTVAVYTFAGDRSADPVHRDITPIATLTWTDGPIEADEPLHTGQSFGAQTLRTQSGTTEFHLTSGALVELRGPTQIALHNPLAATLTRGTATFNCPPSAHGYTVYLPSGDKIVDLGTAFTVSIDDDGRQTVRVYEGRVAVVSDGDDADVSHLVEAGGAGHVRPGGVFKPIAPAVRYVGVHESTQGTLRNTDADQLLDPAPRGDNAYGTDGYVFWGVTPLGQSNAPQYPRGGLPVETDRLRDLPPYIEAVTEAPGTVVARDHDYLPIDDPAAAPSTSPERLESGVLASPRDRNSQPTLMLTIRIGADPPAQGVRLGLLVDNQTARPLTPQMIRIESQHDHAETPPIATASPGDGDMYFFDVSSLSEGDELRVVFTPRDPVRPATLVGLTFDPLPASRSTAHDASSGDNPPDALAPKPATDPEELQTPGPEKTLRKVRGERDEN